MKEINIGIEIFSPKQYEDGFYYAVIQSANRFVGIAKKEPFIRDDMHPIYEPGELWFEFGNTPSEAFYAIVSSLKSERRRQRIDHVSRIRIMDKIVIESIYDVGDVVILPIPENQQIVVWKRPRGRISGIFFDGQNTSYVINDKLYPADKVTSLARFVERSGRKHLLHFFPDENFVV